MEAVALVGTRDGRPYRLLLEDAEGRHAGELSFEEWKRQPGLRLPLRVRPGEQALLSRLEGSGRRLQHAVTRLQRGLELGARDEALALEPGVGDKPVLRGRDVAAFQCARPTRFVDPARLSTSVAKDPALYDVPAKVLVRRVADRFIAAVDRSRALALNTLYCVQPAEGVDPASLASLLNSAVAPVWGRGRVGGADRIFPYLRAEQLAQFPLPDAPLDGLARFRKSGLALDGAVAALYGLSAAEAALAVQPASGG